METVKDRLYRYLDSKRIARSNFEKTIGTGGSYLRNVKTLGSDKLQSILCSYPDLNIEWLLTGEGEMLKDGITQTIRGNNNISSIIGNGNGDVNIGHGREVANGMPSQKDELHRLEKEVETLQKKNEEHLKEIEYLKSVLVYKDSSLADKERLIQILMNNLTNKE